jgi:hypothetical protein
MIGTDDYFKAHPDCRTPEKEANAEAMLEKVNMLLDEAEADGVARETNPHTDCEVAGDGNGGIRPDDTTTGAKGSHHKDGRAVDIFDSTRRFASWCLAHLDRLTAYGLHMERTEWTFSVHGNHWVHLQDVSPASGLVVFIPDRTAPLGPLPSIWQEAA